MNYSKKVYFLILSLKGRSGTERVTCQLANMLDDAGYQIIILNLDTCRESAAFDINKNIDVQYFNGSIFKLLRKIKSLNQEDILFIQNMERLSLITLLVNPKSKNICLEHGVFFTKSKLGKFLTKYLYSRLDALVTITYADAKNYFKFLEVQKVHTIYNSTPFSPKTLTYNSFSKKIIAVGRLSPEKNFSDLVHAWSLIYSRFPDWSLDIYGDGDEEYNLKKLIQELSLKNITIHKNINDIENVYKSASFLVQTSKFEGLGMVLIEAQSYGLPLVAYNCPYGPSEIIVNGKNGILIQDYDVNDLVNGIEKLIINLELRENMYFYALNSNKKFDINLISNQWLNLFNNL